MIKRMMQENEHREMKLREKGKDSTWVMTTSDRLLLKQCTGCTFREDRILFRSDLLSVVDDLMWKQAKMKKAVIQQIMKRKQKHQKEEKKHAKTLADLHEIMKLPQQVAIVELLTKSPKNKRCACKDCPHSKKLAILEFLNMECLEDLTLGAILRTLNED